MIIVSYQLPLEIVKNCCILDHHDLQLQEGLGQLLRLFQKMPRGMEVANCSEKRGNTGQGHHLSIRIFIISHRCADSRKSSCCSQWSYRLWQEHSGLFVALHSWSCRKGLVGLLHTNTGDSIIFKIRVFYKA